LLYIFIIIIITIRKIKNNKIRLNILETPYIYSIDIKRSQSMI